MTYDVNLQVKISEGPTKYTFELVAKCRFKEYTLRSLDMDKEVCTFKGGLISEAADWAISQLLADVFKKGG